MISFLLLLFDTSLTLVSSVQHSMAYFWCALHVFMRQLPILNLPDSKATSVAWPLPLQVGSIFQRFSSVEEGKIQNIIRWGVPFLLDDEGVTLTVNAKWVGQILPGFLTALWVDVCNTLWWQNWTSWSICFGSCLLPRQCHNRDCSPWFVNDCIKFHDCLAQLQGQPVLLFSSRLMWHRTHFRAFHLIASFALLSVNPNETVLTISTSCIWQHFVYDGSKDWLWYHSIVMKKEIMMLLPLWRHDSFQQFFGYCMLCCLPGLAAHLHWKLNSCFAACHHNCFWQHCMWAVNDFGNH